MNAKRTNHPSDVRGAAVRDTILRLLHTHPFARTADLARLLNVSDLTAQKHLYKLQDAGSVCCVNHPCNWYLADTSPQTVSAFLATYEPAPNRIKANRRRYFETVLASVRRTERRLR